MALVILYIGWGFRSEWYYRESWCSYRLPT